MATDTSCHGLEVDPGCVGKYEPGLKTKERRSCIVQLAREFMLIISQGCSRHWSSVSPKAQNVTHLMHSSSFPFSSSNGYTWWRWLWLLTIKSFKPLRRFTVTKLTKSKLCKNKKSKMCLATLQSATYNYLPSFCFFFHQLFYNFVPRILWYSNYSLKCWSSQTCVQPNHREWGEELLKSAFLIAQWCTST